MDTSLQQWPALVVTSGPLAGRSFTIVEPRAVIGRDADVDIRLQSPGVSRRHALAQRQGDGITVEDLGSSNGTWVNGRPVQRPTPLQPGDLVRLGDVDLQYGVIGLPAQRSTDDRRPATYDFGDVGGPVNAGSGNLNAGSGSQYVAGRDVHHGDTYDIDVSNDYDPWDEVWQGSGPGRLLMVVGGIVALLGFGIWVTLLFSAMTTDDPFAETPFDKELLGIPALAVGFGLFAGGGVLAGIGSGMSKAARKRAERRRR